MVGDAMKVVKTLNRQAGEIKRSGHSTHPVIGFVDSKSDALEPLVAGARIALSAIWFLLIQSYRHINEAKFEVIQRVEREYLPLAPYAVETGILKRLRRQWYHWSLSSVERLVPAVFAMLYGAALNRSIAGRLSLSN